MGDEAYPGEVLVEGNRIKAVARGRDQIDASRASATHRRARPVPDAGHWSRATAICRSSIPRATRISAKSRPKSICLRTMRNATLLLNHGFTSAYSAASAKLRLDVVVRQEIEDGYLAGPRYKAAGPEITVTGGLGDERKNHGHFEGFGMIADGVTRSAARSGSAPAKASTTSSSTSPATSSSPTAAPSSSRSARRS